MLDLKKLSKEKQRKLKMLLEAGYFEMFCGYLSGQGISCESAENYCRFYEIKNKGYTTFLE